MHVWCCLGIYFGFRRLEWLQPDRTSPIVPNEFDTLPRAFIIKDIRFYGRNMTRITHDQALHATIEEVHYLEITWRCQKNGQNGETKIACRDDINPNRCSVRADLRIIRRARNLDLPADHLAAVFTPSGLATPNDVLLMCASDICDSLRTTARRLYNMNILKFRQFWTLGGPLGVVGVTRRRLLDLDEFGIAMQQTTSNSGHCHTSFRIRKAGHYCRDTKITCLLCVELWYQ